MPPEPPPWDRKDRKQPQDRFSSDAPGVGGGVGPHRWRDHNPPSHHNHYYYPSSRWVSADFRRRQSPGHGKQGDWHLYPEESGHVFVPSRTSEKIPTDESFRQAGSRVDIKHRGAWVSKLSVGQKERKDQFSEASSLENGPDRPNGTCDGRPVDDMPQHNSSSEQSASANLQDQYHVKDHDDMNSSISKSGSAGSRFDKENSLVDWKPKTLKWRPGSLTSSRGSYNQSNGSKIIGVDSTETKTDSQPQHLAPVQSSPVDVVTGAACSFPCEETNSRKKPRLGWGEGLAKYESKKVESPDDASTRNGTAISGTTAHSHLLNPLGNSPRVLSYSDCASPATPSSVACSFSPGIEEKQSNQSVNVDNDSANLSTSPNTIPQVHIERSAFNLENLDINNLNSSIIKILQPDDQISVDTDFMRSSALNKLLVWKGDISKAVEVIESEIDSLENELKSLNAEADGTVCSSLLVGVHSEACEQLENSSKISPRSDPLHVVSSGVTVVEKSLDPPDSGLTKVHDRDINIPGLPAMSELVDVMPSVNDVCPSDSVNLVECSLDSVLESRDMGSKCPGDGPSEDGTGGPCASGDGAGQTTGSCRMSYSEVSLPHDCGDLYNQIVAANKASATRASEVFNKLLQGGDYQVDCSTFAGKEIFDKLLGTEPCIKDKFKRRRHFSRFKERVIALKFRILQQLWKEDVSLLSSRKFRSKPQKKLDLCLRTGPTFHQKLQLSVRSRIPCPARNLTLVPSAEIVNFASRLLSDSHVKIYRDTLKMPALILDKRENTISRFISNNGLVEDPYAIEKERSMINPWTPEERETFIEKLAAFGKDFGKIASSLDHKTTGDCIEFYYKNHKSDSFEKTKKPKFANKGKSYSASTYLVASRKRWSREANAVSLDVLGAASAIASNVDDGMEVQHKSPSKYILGKSSDYKARTGDNGLLVRSNSLDIYNNERENVAVDVLVGICGSLSSEAMSSCITSSVDPGEGYQERKCRRVISSASQPLTPEVTQYVEAETYDSCEEGDAPDWTDEEKSLFIQAVSSHGKDFSVIARCVGTRSRDQCKVFYSKARKCLGLDQICPETDNLESLDANGGASDTEDACIVESNPVVCCEKLGLDVQLVEPFPDNKTRHETGVEKASVKHDIDQDQMDDNEDNELMPKSVATASHQIEGEPNEELVLDANINNHSTAVALQDHKHVDTEAGQVDCETIEQSIPVKLQTEAESRAIDDLLDDNTKLDGQADLLPDGSPGGDRVGNGDVTENDACTRKCSMQDVVKFELEVPGITLHDAVDSNSSSSSGASSGCQEKGNVESGCGLNPQVNSMEQNSCPAPEQLTPQVSAATKDENQVRDAMPVIDLEKVGGSEHDESPTESSGLSKCLISEHVESSQILAGYPLPVTTSNENDGIRCSKSIFERNIQKLGRIPSLENLASDFFLQRCTNSKHRSSVMEVSFSQQEQTRNHSAPLACSSSDTEKPNLSPLASGSLSDVERPSNRDVKLFGQILSKPSSQQRSDGLNIQQKDGSQQPNLGSRSLTVRFTGEQIVDGSSPPPNFEPNGFTGSENRPVRNLGVWGGNIPTGFPSLPDSAILMAKYPAAFGNYIVPSSKMEQTPVHAISRSSDSNLKGVTVISRDSSSSNGSRYPLFRSREMQPFAIDMKQRQEAILAEMQRRNGFDVVSSIQPQGRAVVGINVAGRNGVLVGGQGTGISDPVAALRMHYAKAEQFSAQPTSIVRGDDSWRGNGDIGR